MPLGKPTYIFFIFFFQGLFSWTFSQQTLDFKEQHITQSGFLHFWKDTEDLQHSPVASESVLDLFQPALIDSNLIIRTQRHRFPLSAAIEYIGKLYWESLTMKKEKFIGTCAREASVHDGMLKEYDANYFPTPHLPEYVDKLMMAKMGMQIKGRGVEHGKIYKPPFECVEDLKVGEKGYLSAECECTTHRGMRPELDSLFYPAKSGSKMKDHPNMGTPYIAMGFYGPLVLDCNHECHPEIHPYEWIWYTDFHSEKAVKKNTRSFLVGLFSDVSRRFRSWSNKPRVGRMKIPVAIPVEAKRFEISLEQLVVDEFYPKGFRDLSPALPDMFPADFEEKNYRIGNCDVALNLNRPAPAHGLRLGFSDFDLDKRQGLYCGHLILEASVESVFTLRVTQNWQK